MRGESVFTEIIHDEALRSLRLSVTSAHTLHFLLLTLTHTRTHIMFLLP